jgi:hypothetical protein
MPYFRQCQIELYSTFVFRQCWPLSSIATKPGSASAADNARSTGKGSQHAGKRRPCIIHVRDQGHRDTEETSEPCRSEFPGSVCPLYLRLLIRIVTSKQLVLSIREFVQYCMSAAHSVAGKHVLIRHQPIALRTRLASQYSHDRTMGEQTISILFGCLATVLAIVSIILAYIQYRAYTRQSTHNTTCSSLETGHPTASTTSIDLEVKPGRWSSLIMPPFMINTDSVRKL